MEILWKFIINYYFQYPKIFFKIGKQNLLFKLMIIKSLFFLILINKIYFFLCKLLHYLEILKDKLSNQLPQLIILKLKLITTFIFITILIK